MPDNLGLCACMGPVNGDPYCPCEMRRRGLEPADIWTLEKIAELHAALASMFDWKDETPL